MKIVPDFSFEFDEYESYFQLALKISFLQKIIDEHKIIIIKILNRKIPERHIYMIYEITYIVL